MKQPFKVWANSDKPRLGMWVMINDPTVIEMAKKAGFDYVRIDNEYIPFDFQTIAEMARIANFLDLPIFVRVSRIDDITSLLSCGVDGIIVPNCNTIETAKQAINLVKYSPIGARGIHPGSRAYMTSHMNTEEYMKSANDYISLTIQIEDVKAEAYLDELISLEGIDFISSGRNDISQSLGLIGQVTHPKVMAFEDKLIDCALKHKKIPAILVRSKEEMQKIRNEKGINMFTVASDDPMLRKAMADKVQSFR